MQMERWLGALRERNFRLYFVGQLTSAIGSGMAPVAVAFAVLARHHASASDVGVVLAAGAVPLVLFTLVGGVAADRFGRRAVMFTADSLRCTAELGLGAWILLTPPPLWGFVVLAALVGTGTAFFMPASTGLIQQVVSEAKRSQANALNGLSSSLGGIVGPAIAGVIVAASSPGWAVLADGFSYAVSVAALVAMRLGSWESERGESFVQQLRQGWREFWSRMWLWVIVVLASLFNVLMLSPFLVLGPVIAKHYLGGAPAWGAALAANGAGAVIGGILMLRLHIRRPLVFALVTVAVWPWPLLALAYRWPLALLAAGTFFGGMSFAFFAVQWDTTMQREIPPEVLGRVSAYDWFGSLVFLPIGFAIIGPISSVIGVRTTFVIGACFAVLSTVTGLCVPSIRQMRAPLPSSRQAAVTTGVAG
ncbi:MAG TPA: MFS transporter [Acidimicrobiales bacterium]|nr:MFS transporter [Acidimicrobiales bacterium]